MQAIEPTQTELLKVGQLAERTGLSVRSLHWYDEIGLLSPSRRTRSGHRLYGAADIARLQQIVSLRSLGFGLAEIREFLGRSGFSAGEAIELHLARLREQITAQQKLYARLEAIASGLRATEEASVDELIQTIEAIVMFENHYTPQQLEELKQRGQALGEDRIRAVEAEWPELIAKMRAEMEKGSDPASEDVQALARRWSALVAEFTGGDPGIERSLSSMYASEPQAGQQFGLDAALFEFVGRAQGASRPAGPPENKGL